MSWRKALLIADHYNLVVQQWGLDSVVLTTIPGSERVHIMHGASATAEDLMHEMAHFILMELGISPWLVIPAEVRKGWRDKTLPPDWMAVADAANDKDHGLAMGKIYRDLCQLINT